MGVPSALVLVLITILLPPVGVFLIHGCGAELLINICLTLLGYLPGHIHAFYLEYVYYKRKEQGQVIGGAPVGQGGYGTIAQ